MMNYFKDQAGGVHALSDIDITNGGKTLLPSGCVEIAEDEARRIANPPESQADALARAIAEVRVQRAPILDALAGIAGRASRSNDTATAEAADQAADDLLAITQLPAMTSSSTYDEMKAAVMARYREIAGAAPATVQTAFREIFAS